MPTVSKKHLKSDKAEAKRIYKNAEKIERDAEKLQERDVKLKKSKSTKRK